MQQCAHPVSLPVVFSGGFLILIEMQASNTTTPTTNTFPAECIPFITAAGKLCAHCQKPIKHN